MPRTKEEQKEYGRQHYLNNKEKRDKQIKEWNEVNKEKVKAYHHQWKKKLKE